MPWKTWGDAFDANLRKGYDHGYAAWRADQWEREHMKKRAQQAYQQWWDKMAAQSDPHRRLTLTADAFQAGWDAAMKAK